MKRRFMGTLAVMLAVVVVAGCGQVAKEEVGALVGAGLGGLAGSMIGDGGGRLVAVGVGTMIGAIMGGEVGKSLDRADRLALAQARHEALENGVSGTSTTWQNPDSGNSGQIVPQPAYKQDDGTYCREFQLTIIVGAEMQAAYGKACRQPDGAWKVS
ncbi:MAG: RT0821/Lpp0805 family surface protein [Rhodospirillaceae bacterium]|nr:RT0821/Lpp0805 family surface protein [Rhodospirillaceae bacterium]